MIDLEPNSENKISYDDFINIMKINNRQIIKQLMK